MFRRLWKRVRTRQWGHADGFFPPRRALPSVEMLETRVLLDGAGVIWGNGSNLTLSFAPDGTDIGGHPSSLHSTLDAIATEPAWNESVLRAFQTWAVHTNVGIGVVSDGGQPFGTNGRTQGDPRFGDVRVGAIPLSPDVMAVSIARDLVVSGTWVGDIVFNSDADLNALDDVFGVALHETGHVLGLGHTDDPLSPMFRHGVPTSTVPTAEDIADLQALYGKRQPDAYEHAKSQSDGDDDVTPGGNETDGSGEDTDEGVDDTDDDQGQEENEPNGTDNESEVPDNESEVPDNESEVPDNESEQPDEDVEDTDDAQEPDENEPNETDDESEASDDGPEEPAEDVEDTQEPNENELGDGENEPDVTDEMPEEPESEDNGSLDEENQGDANETEELDESDDADETDRPDPENDQIENSTQLELLSAGEADEGSAPSIIFGDIDQPGDVDYYTLPVPSDYLGPLTVSLRTEGFSLLAPSLSVLDDSGLVLGNVVSSSISGDHLTLTLESVTSYEYLTLRVEGTRDDVFGLGDYSLVSVFDGLNQVDRTTIEDLSRGEYRFLDHDDIRDLLKREDDDQPRYNDDGHTDDQFEVELPEETAPGFAPFTRFELIGSITDASDVDHYKIQAPTAADLSVMTVYVTPLDHAALVPELAVFDSERQQLDGQVLANGGGDYIVQFSNVTPDDEYTLRVSAADSLGRFNTGNYRLIVAYGQNAVSLDAFAVGTITPAAPQAAHVLHVGQSSLFYLALDAANESADNANRVMLDLQNSDQQSVFRLSSNPGQLRTAGTVLLAPGSYLAQVVGLDAAPDSLATIPYSIRGMVATTTIGISPGDPTDQPAFRCQDSPDTFCYPGGTRTADRFVWQSPVDLSTESPQIDNPELTSLFFGDWWSWYWGLGAENQTPATGHDRYDVDQGVPMNVPAETGVLRNDVDTEGDPITVVLLHNVQHGELRLLPTGAFTYRPNGDFTGTDSFTYIASDLNGQSEATQVTLQVRQAPSPLMAHFIDVTPSARLQEVTQVAFEFSESVVGLDISDLVLTRDSGANLLDAQVTLESPDQIHWTLGNLGALTERPGSYELTLVAAEAGVGDVSGASLATDALVGWANVRRAGDADASGAFDRFDIVQVLRSDKYRSRATATWAEGDWNGDGFFDQFDIAWALETNQYR